ncbi:MAG: hypothetical protein CMA72_08145 [Euryarchaeota archaeon]|nr:hypothetical protein [Euryarchaeota archaeon]|tara:strand:- start:36 stop:281 length:246 start_codon:yes stop_codon:yes gene_type:complete
MELGRTMQFRMRHLFTQDGWARCGELTVEEFSILIQLINLDRFANFYITAELIDAALDAVELERKNFVGGIARTFKTKEWD